MQSNLSFHIQTCVTLYRIEIHILFKIKIFTILFRINNSFYRAYTETGHCPKTICRDNINNKNNNTAKLEIFYGLDLGVNLSRHN